MMNTNGNSIQISVRGNPDTLFELSPRLLRPQALENLGVPLIADLPPLSRREEDGRDEAARSNQGLLVARSVLPMVQNLTGELWEAAVSALLWLCGLMTIALCFL